MAERAFLRVKDWREFQHYKGRRPPWIKLHRGLLDNYEFHSLPDASRALAPCIWLLASEYDEGAIPWNPSAIAFRLRMDETRFLAALNPLIEAGFLTCDDNASGALAECKQNHLSESEEETETEEERHTAAQALPADEEPHQNGHDARKRTTRGTRLPAGWLPSADERQFAESLGLNADVVGEEFRDFWVGVPGQRGCKLDWPATFRNRCREVASRRRASPSGPNGTGIPATGGGVGAAAARFLARRGLT